MKKFNTIKIVGLDIICTNPPCYLNSTERNSELTEAHAIIAELKKKQSTKPKIRFL